MLLLHFHYHIPYVLWQTPKLIAYLFRQFCSLSDAPIVSWLECNVRLCLFLVSLFVSFCIIVGYTALLSFTSRSSLCWCLLSPSCLSSTYFLSNRRQGNSVYFGMLSCGWVFWCPFLSRLSLWWVQSSQTGSGNICITHKQYLGNPACGYRCSAARVRHYVFCHCLSLCCEEERV